MKLHGEWLVLAERVINDSLTQNLTLVSCLEQVAAADFPTVYPGFAVAARYRCVGPPPGEPVRVRYRLLRLCDTDAPETLAEYDGEWAPGTTRARIATNFQVLRLKRPETVTFRVDHRVGDGDWQEGPTCALEVVRLELTPEQRAALAAEARRLGIKVPGGGS